MLLSDSSASPAIKEYRRYRKAGKELNDKIIGALVDRGVIEETARALGVGRA